MVTISMPSEGVDREEPLQLVENTVIIVLGASGDLARKKTFPALFGLYCRNLLPIDVKIVGYARTVMDDQEYYNRIKSYIKTPTQETQEQLDRFCQICTYVSGQYDQDDSYKRLDQHILTIEKGVGHRLFYLALPPSVFIVVSEHLKRNCYPTAGICRLIIEKPFGKDLESSRKLQQALEVYWTEEEIFRIDHYLGKEMVKNILPLRFGNSIFAATWNRHYIDSIQIDFKEPFGTEGRGGYFDEFGIIRDVMQNHLLQVFSLLAMERPINFLPENIRNEKVKVLQGVSSINAKDVILGQYGRSVDGQKPSYRDDNSVPANSRCPTFCALALSINNERWFGVPFILTAGKALDQALVEVRVQFKPAAPVMSNGLVQNTLVIRVQPNEAIYLTVNSKEPGLSTRNVCAKLDVIYKNEFPGHKIPEAYESLLLDALKGEHSNFVRDDELDASWKLFTPILNYFDNDENLQPVEYPYGSYGPQGFDDFLVSHNVKPNQASV